VTVPEDAEEAAVTLSVELKVGVPDVGLNDPDTPLGAPDRLRATLCAAPDTKLTVTV
jgi:hypothetical protein